MAVEIGDSGDNILIGGPGDDILIGRRGSDILEGLEGRDELFGGVADDVLYGGDGADTLYDGVGSDSLFGGKGFDVFRMTADLGNDVIYGGKGPDIVVYDLRPYGPALDVIVDLQAGTAGRVGSERGVDTLVSIEGVIIIGGADATVIGDDKRNLIYTRAGDDELYGGRGRDLIFSGDGDDVIYGGAGRDRLEAGKGDDIVYGGGGFDLLRGWAGDDELYGGAGTDILIGGAGRDLMWGGDGTDYFVFRKISDFSVREQARDMIMDFEQGIDRIHLAGIDPSDAPGDQAFSFSNGDGFSGRAKELIAFVDGNVTRVQGDIDSDSIADFEFLLAGAFTLTAEDFVL
jgi:Ca2+-binding RTX toxin-like protein